jgi:hypothetical protein
LAPKDPVKLPLRWEFLPIENARDGAVHWKWRAYTQTGELALECEQPFETLTECMNDAKAHGYAAPR